MIPNKAVPQVRELLLSEAQVPLIQKNIRDGGKETREENKDVALALVPTTIRM